jgi:large subunit ribosomal protein L6
MFNFLLARSKEIVYPPTMSVTTTTTALLRSLPRTIPPTRAFTTTSSTRSQIGKLPLTIPSGVTLHLPPLSIPSSIPASSASAKRTLKITGPLGDHLLPIPSAIVLQPPSASTGAILNEGSLTLSVQDPTTKSQKALWGLTRALLANALTGVSEGYRLALRLVGVGYRANVEPIPESLRNIANRIPTASRTTTTEVPTLAPPTQRLNMKLGYAHPIYIDIPSDITVTTPQPTRIVLSGTDKQRLGLFAAKIRRWRKPEPYRGKVSTHEEWWEKVADSSGRVFLLGMRRSSSRRSRKSSWAGCMYPAYEYSVSQVFLVCRAAFGSDSSCHLA